MEAWQASLNVALYGFVIANVVWYASACFGRNSVCLQLWNIVAQWRAPRAFLTDRRKSQNEFQKNLKSVIEQRRVEWARGALRTICMFAFVLVSAMLLLEVKEFPITAACFFVGGFASFAAQVFGWGSEACLTRESLFIAGIILALHQAPRVPPRPGLDQVKSGRVLCGVVSPNLLRSDFGSPQSCGGVPGVLRQLSHCTWSPHAVLVHECLCAVLPHIVFS